MAMVLAVVGNVSLGGTNRLLFGGGGSLKSPLLQLRSMMAAYLQKESAGSDDQWRGFDAARPQQCAAEGGDGARLRISSRRHVTVTVDGMSGGTLDDVIQEGSPTCEVKSCDGVRHLRR